MLFAVPGFAQNGACCDINGANYIGPFPCQGAGEPDGTYQDDGVACDPDCTDYDVCNAAGECYDPASPACSIPIDGGLGLLALAGGGLATAAMRRRKEEEAAQKAV